MKKEIEKEEKISIKEKNEIEKNIKELEIGNIEKMEKDLIIQVELIKVNYLESREYYLNFIKVKGALRDYYQKLKEIMNYAENFI